MTDAAVNTVRHAVRAAAARLTAAGIATPGLDARVLAEHVLRCTPTELVLRLDEPLAAEQSSGLAHLVERRAAGEPTAYLTGRKEFYGVEFAVTPDVLIPRPETELLVERAIDALPEGARVVDLGTGSGAIATAIARHRPDIRVLAVDRSAAAARVARNNVRVQGLERRVGVVCSDLLAAVRWPLDGVLANLPYLTTDEIPALSAEVRWEPRLALDGGGDGLTLYRRLFTDLAARRPTPALVLCEIAPLQSDTILALASAALPGHRVQIVPDLAGRARLLEAQGQS
jgi:release factor glutamine methyltransferase